MSLKFSEKLPVTYLACKAASRSFLCQYVFPLCDCKTGDIYLPSQETCQEISTVTCKTFWPLLKQLIQPLKLPECLALPMATYPPGIIYMYTVKWNKRISICTYRYQWFWLLKHYSYCWHLIFTSR